MTLTHNIRLFYATTFIKFRQMITDFTSQQSLLKLAGSNWRPYGTATTMGLGFHIAIT